MFRIYWLDFKMIICFLVRILKCEKCVVRACVCVCVCLYVYLCVCVCVCVYVCVCECVVVFYYIMHPNIGKYSSACVNTLCFTHPIHCGVYVYLRFI